MSEEIDMTDYIIGLREIRKMGYRKQPKLIRSEYRGAKADIEGYHGRELLELLQNAVDEMEEAGINSVYIDFRENILTFSNTGKVFSKEGCDSLLYKNTGSKDPDSDPGFDPEHEKPEYIGSKGTGFRSVLNWSDRIQIYSGSLHVEFSSTNATEMFKYLLRKNPELEELKGKYHYLNVPTLVAPKKIKNLSEKDFGNFNTVIRLYIKDDMADNVRKQIKELKPETMLFLNKLKKMIMECDGEKSKYRKSPGDEPDAVVVTALINGEEKNFKWKIVTEEEKIMVEKEEKNYSVAIAFKPDMSLSPPDVLYSFFKTEINFPFLANGTFELDAERNHLNKTQSNKAVLEKICLRLIKTAKEKCENGVNYEALKLLNIKSFPEELSWFGIEDFYYNAVMQSDVFPTVNNKYISFNQDIKFYESNIADFVEGENFKNLLQHTDDDDMVHFIKKLAVRKNKGYIHRRGFDDKLDNDKQIDEFINKCEHAFNKIDLKVLLDFKYEYNYIVQAINLLLSKKTIKERVALCLGFMDEYRKDIKALKDRRVKYFPGFILDSYGDEVECNQDVFLSLDVFIEKNPPPKFACINLMNKEMYNEFLSENKKHSDVDNVEQDLKQKLLLFNVESSELWNIIKSTIDKFRVIESTKKNAANCAALNRWLWKLFKTPLGEIFSQYYINGILVNRKGQIKEANELYYGKDYGNDITENLFSNQDQWFVVTPKTFRLKDDERQKFCEFLKTIGVKKFPGIIRNEPFLDPPPEYIEKLKSDLQRQNHPTVGDRVIEKDEARNILIDRIDVDRIEHYNFILENARTEHILEWLDADKRAGELVISGHEISTQSSCHCTLKRVNGQISGYILKNEIPCFMKFEFSRKQWIEADGKRYAPEECLQLQNRIKIRNKLIPVLIEPNLGIHATKKWELLHKIGAPKSFGDLSTNLLYGTLLKLSEPGIDEKGELSEELYKSVIKKSSIDIDENNDNYKKFKKEGKVYCKNKKKYESYDEVYYLAKKNISSAVIEARKVNFIAIDKENVEKNVEKYFGVKKLVLSCKIAGEPDPHDLDNKFNRDFKDSWDYAFCYILSRVPNPEKKLSSIKAMKVVYCKEIKVNYNPEEEPLDDYGFIRDDKGVIYAKIPEKITMEKARADLKFCKMMANIITSALEVNDEILFLKLEKLYGTEKSEREKLIQNDPNSMDYLDEARRILTTVVPPRDLFKNACKDIGHFKKLPDEIDELSNKIDFWDINMDENAEKLIRIMEILEIDNINRFKESGFEEEIDIRPFYERKYKDLKGKREVEYKNKLFASLIYEEIEEQKEFVKRFVDYIEYQFSLDKAKKYNVDAEFNKLCDEEWPELLTETKEDAEEHRKKNWEVIYKERDKNILDELLSDNENLSLLYFEKRLDDLIELYEEKAKERETQKRKEKIILESPIPPCPSETIDDTVATENDPSHQKGEKGAGGGPVVMLSGRDKDEWAKFAEKVVLEDLKGKDNTEEVKWVSGYARGEKEGEPDAEDGKGYDIEYKDKDRAGKTVFVEVKSTNKAVGNSFKINITQNELETGEREGESYVIAIVANVKDEEKRAIKYLPNLFVYKDDENRHENSRFTLSETDYVIKTKRLTAIERAVKKHL